MVIKDKDGAEVAIATEETEGLEFPGQYPIKMDADANVTVDIANFKWDEVYTIEAKYDLDDAVITVTVVLTTVDRNREKVTLPTYEYTFVINKLDAETGYGYIEEPGYYYWNTDQDPAIADQIKAAFEKVTEAGISVTKASDFTGQEDFNTKELVNKVAPAGEPDGAGTAFGYVSISNSMESAYTQESFKPAVLAGEIFNSGKQSEDDPNLWLGNEVYRNITTYIGEVVVIPFKFNYKVPDYNFLHLSYYTFNTDTQIDGPVIPYVQKDNFADNDGTVKWWTQVLPSYFTAAAAGNNGPAGPAGPAGPGGNPAPGNDGPAGPAGPAGPGQNNNNNARVSFRHALADYDVTYINLAELAFNLVDDKDEIIEAADAEALGLEVHFDYADETQWAKDLPLVDQLLPDFVVYKNLWIDSTTFYYRTNEKKFIKALGKLTLTSGDPTPGMGGYVFPVATRFNYPKKAVKFDYVLDYSTYAMVRWTPFQEPKTNGNGITLDEHRIYRVPVLKGMELKDNRPAGVSYYVIQDGEWVKGNVAEFDAEAGTYTTGGNGYIKNVMANQAYHITTTFDYSKLDLPAELRKLLVIKYSADGVNFEDDQNDEGTLTPYFQFDYTSEVEFRGTVSIPVEVKLENPWQEDIIFKYNFIIKGATTPVAGDDNNNGGDDNANNGD